MEFVFHLFCFFFRFNFPLNCVWRRRRRRHKTETNWFFELQKVDRKPNSRTFFVWTQTSFFFVGCYISIHFHSFDDFIKIQGKPINVITLGPREIDHIIRMITISESTPYLSSLKSVNGPTDHINRLISLSVITLKCLHCKIDRNFNNSSCNAR